MAQGPAGQSRRRKIGLTVAVVVVIAAIAVGLVAVFGGKSSSTKPPQAAATPAQTTGVHRFLRPECAPVNGPSWVYPGVAKMSSHLYESFAINYSCAQAANWTKRIATQLVKVPQPGSPALVQGPPGFDCQAWPDADGHAYAGGCQKGTKTAFGWNWNVANSRETLERGENGKFQIVSLGGVDTQTILKPLPGGRFEIEVMNTSGIGFLNKFTWSAPPGWTIEKLTSATGSHCTLSGNSTVVCSGKVDPPHCLCAGNGGVVKIQLKVNQHLPKASKSGAPVSYGYVGAKLRINAMTPVPYLIPGTPQEEKRQQSAQKNT